MAAATTLRAREAEDKRARFGYRRPAARTSPSSSIPLQEGPARAGDDGRASGGAGAASKGRAQRFGNTAMPQRAGVTYINLCVGTPYGDPVKLAKAIAEYYGLKLLAVVVDDGDEPAVAYARSKEIRERIFAALESEDLEEALAKRFARTRAVVLSIFDGEDTIVAIAR